MSKYQVQLHGEVGYVKADYVRFDGSFTSFWERAERHSGKSDRLIVAYPAERVESISQKD